MGEILKHFDELLRIYSEIFTCSEHCEDTFAGLIKSLPTVSGVYLIWRKADNNLLYIGSSGKITKLNASSTGNVKMRISASTTPYNFQRAANLFRYGPTTSGVPPEGYHYTLNISEIRVTIIAKPCNFAPTVLEHLFIQGYINQFKRLPEVNQKI